MPSEKSSHVSFFRLTVNGKLKLIHTKGRMERELSYEEVVHLAFPNTRRKDLTITCKYANGHSASPAFGENLVVYGGECIDVIFTGNA